MSVLDNSVASAVVLGDIKNGHRLATIILAMGTDVVPVRGESGEIMRLRLWRGDAGETIEIPLTIAEDIWSYVETIHDKPTVSGVAKLAYQLVSTVPEEWQKVLDLIDGKCTVSGCGEWVASEDKWSPEVNDLATEMCPHHLAETLEDENADFALAVAKETAA